MKFLVTNGDGGDMVREESIEHVLLSHINVSGFCIGFDQRAISLVRLTMEARDYPAVCVPNKDGNAISDAGWSHRPNAIHSCMMVKQVYLANGTRHWLRKEPIRGCIAFPGIRHGGRCSMLRASADVIRLCHKKRPGMDRNFATTHWTALLRFRIALT